MLQHEYLIAKIGVESVDTTENHQMLVDVWQTLQTCPILPQRTSSASSACAASACVAKFAKPKARVAGPAFFRDPALILTLVTAPYGRSLRRHTRGSSSRFFSFFLFFSQKNAAKRILNCKIGADTAENEPIMGQLFSKFCKICARFGWEIRS